MTTATASLKQLGVCPGMRCFSSSPSVMLKGLRFYVRKVED